jgi:hypothetical protein
MALVFQYDALQSPEQHVYCKESFQTTSKEWCDIPEEAKPEMVMSTVGDEAMNSRDRSISMGFSGSFTVYLTAAALEVCVGISNTQQLLVPNQFMTLAEI